jgi:hypothetical protein
MSLKRGTRSNNPWLGTICGRPRRPPGAPKGGERDAVGVRGGRRQVTAALGNGTNFRCCAREAGRSVFHTAATVIERQAFTIDNGWLGLP